MRDKTFNPADWKEATAVSMNNSNLAEASISDDIECLTQRIEAKKIDITGDYHQWLEIGFALKEALGEDGRSYFHRISRFYPAYDEIEADRQYDKCMRSKGKGIKPGTLFYYAKLAGIQIKSEYVSSESEQTPVRGIEGSEGLRECRMPTFSQDVRGRLPKILDDVVCNANSEEDADLLILGSIVSLSACLPHISGVYGDRPVYPNLFLFVSAPASAGKGRLTLCRRLVQPIHKQMQL